MKPRGNDSAKAAQGSRGRSYPRAPATTRGGVSRHRNVVTTRTRTRLGGGKLGRPGVKRWVLHDCKRLPSTQGLHLHREVNTLRRPASPKYQCSKDATAKKSDLHSTGKVD